MYKKLVSYIEEKTGFENIQIDNVRAKYSIEYGFEVIVNYSREDKFYSIIFPKVKYIDIVGSDL